jgi:hypothetical protein
MNPNSTQLVSAGHVLVAVGAHASEILHRRGRSDVQRDTIVPSMVLFRCFSSLVNGSELTSLLFLCFHSLSMTVIFISYELHTHYRPFLEHNDELFGDSTLLRSSRSKLAVEVYVCGASIRATARNGLPRQQSCGHGVFPPFPIGVCQRVKHNALESAYLLTSLFILLSGMTFQSGVATEGSGAYLLLTFLVAIVLVLCVAGFLGLLVFEMWRSVRFARTLSTSRRRARIVSLAGTPGQTPALPSSAGTGSDSKDSGSNVTTKAEGGVSQWMWNPLGRPASAVSGARGPSQGKGKGLKGATTVVRSASEEALDPAGGPPPRPRSREYVTQSQSPVMVHPVTLLRVWLPPCLLCRTELEAELQALRQEVNRLRAQLPPLPEPTHVATQELQ